MDFSTPKIKIPEHLKLLELAICCLSENSISHILCSNNSNWDRKQIRISPKNLYSGGKHRHPYPEIAIMLEGECFLASENDAFPISFGDIVICQPELNHCEGILKKSVKYSILWLVGSQDALLAMVSRYRPGKGWDTPFRWAFRGDSVKRLFKWFKAYEIPPVEQWFLSVRSELFIALASLYNQSLQTPNQITKSRRPALEKLEPVLREIKVFLKNHYTQSISLQQLAQSTGMSPNYLNALFSRYTGQPIHSYIIRLRMEKAATLLESTPMLIKQVARAVGYEDPLYFSRAFKKYHGYWPSER